MDGGNMAWRHDIKSHPVLTLPFGIALRVVGFVATGGSTGVEG